MKINLLRKIIDLELNTKKEITSKNILIANQILILAQI